MKTIFQKPLFWRCFIIGSFLCFIYTLNFFPRAFPIVNLTITMDRDQALTKSLDLANRFKWGPEQPSTAVSFDTDSKTQTFIELEGGGQQTYITMLKNHWYEPYTWHVRLLREFETNETHIYFTPDGTLYGFKEIIAEDKDLPSLKKSEALSWAKTNLEQEWHIDLRTYDLVEASKKVQQNNRIDRTFVFERNDLTLNDGRYRLKVVITGNKLTEVKHFIKIPEAFTLTYKHMRSYNTTIASAGAIFAYLVYLLIGCLVGLFILLRSRWIIWTTSVKWALLIATLDFLTVFNSLPILWMQYKTEGAMQAFLLEITVQALTYFFIRLTTLSLIFITSEGLTRRAFGNNIQFWNCWSPHIANSYSVLGQTVAGYLLVGIDLAFLVSFYLFTTYYFSWWSPLSQIVDPDVLAHYLPWFSSIALSLGAGFVEECQFRAIPLAGAALLGERYGKKRWWMIAAFIIQAVVFSAAHASYPAQPAYARLVELIVPSCIFAALYLRFGLLVPIIAHYTYDAILFALPIFATHTAYAWINQSIVITLIFAPLGIVLYQRYRTGYWQILPSDAYNNAWQPTTYTQRTVTMQPTVIHLLTTQKRYLLLLMAAFGLGAWTLTTRFTSDASSLMISKQDAIHIAQQTLSNYNMALDEHYQAYAQIQPNIEYDEKAELQHTYIWQTYGQSTYHTLMGTYLKPPHWLIRFLRFEGSLIERAQEYEVRIGSDRYELPQSYTSLSWKHSIPEQIAGTSLTKKEALLLIQETLPAHEYNMETFELMKAKPKQLPERTDWHFTFAHKQDPKLRLLISVAGDQIQEIDRKILVPEQFKRNEQKDQALHKTLKMLCQLLIWILFIIGLLYALMHFAHQDVPWSFAIIGFITFISLFAIDIYNNWPHVIAQFNTQAPFINQLFTTYALTIARYIVRASILASVCSFMIAYQPKYRYSTSCDILYAGISSGLLLHGLWALHTWYKPSIKPLWAYYDAIDTCYPMLGFVLHYLIQWTFYTLALSLCAIGFSYLAQCNKARNIFAILLLSIIICFTMIGMQSFETLSYWLLSSALLGISMALIWYTILQFAYAGIAAAVATSFILSIIQQMMFHDIAHVWLSGLLSIVLILGLSYCWFMICIRHDQHASL